MAPETWSSQPQENKKIISEEAIRDLPKLKIEEGKIYGDFQIGKHTKMSHKKLQHLTTSKVLELLHIDLMRPMQVEIDIMKPCFIGNRPLIKTSAFDDDN